MLWIALVLPELALQVSHRGLLPDLPLVVSDGAAQRPAVIAANQPARDAGIVPGMAVAAAQALVQQLVVQAHDPAREQAAVHAVAVWATQFSPSVALEPDAVLLEVQASLRLFGGLTALGTRLERGAVKLGFAVSISVAPTPLAALLFARARVTDPSVRGCVTPDQLATRLAPLPLTLLNWTPATLEKLARLGISTIGACRTLPRDGLIRRFGAELVHDLDRADGRMPDPRTWFLPPLRFVSRIDLAAELSQVDWLTLPVRQLLTELEGYLQALHHGTQQLLLTFEQGRRLQFTVEIATSAPCCFADEFIVLVQEQLARTELSAPVQAVVLRVERLVPYVAQNRALITDGNSHALGWAQLCDRLVARLPSGQLHRLAIGDDHRPEKAWRWKADLHGASGKAAQARQPQVQQMQVPEPPRPAWLLQQPRPLSVLGGLPHFDGPLTLLTEPERIEAGWWDEHAVSRDYYIGRNPTGQLCWVFHDHADDGWCLHGLFG
jgi:protein ImuB